jgi:hypothetical protein
MANKEEVKSKEEIEEETKSAQKIKEILSDPDSVNLLATYQALVDKARVLTSLRDSIDREKSAIDDRLRVKHKLYESPHQWILLACIRESKPVHDLIFKQMREKQDVPAVSIEDVSSRLHSFDFTLDKLRKYYEDLETRMKSIEREHIRMSKKRDF